MRRGIALFAGGAALLVAACGGGGDAAASDGGAPPGVLADRILRLGEDLATVVDVLHEDLPVGLSAALNPEATAETPPEDLVSVPVHAGGRLIGSFRIERPDGVKNFYLLYDIAEDDRAVERALTRELDQTPWQVIAGQSAEGQAGVRFQSTVSSDIDGTAIIRVVSADEAAPLTSVVYIVEVRPFQLVDAAAFALPAARPVPDDFPAPFLVLDGMTPINVRWGSSPGGDTYQLLMLTRESAFDVTAQYRDRLAAEGWELTDDRAIGFATQLDFQSGDGRMTATLTADAFTDDDSYTSIQLELRTSSRSAGN